MAVDVMAGIRKAAKVALRALRTELGVIQEKIEALEKLAGGSNGKAKAKGGRPKGSTNKATKNTTKGKGVKKRSQADSNAYAIKLVKDSGGREWKIRELNARLQQDGYRKSAKAALKAGGLRITGKDPWANVSAKKD